MKKIKILIPAIAAIALTGAATVTGTVAWFTVNRTQNTFINTITVKDPASNLTVKFKENATNGGLAGSEINAAADTATIEANLWNSTVDMSQAAPTIGYAMQNSDPYQEAPADLIRILGTPNLKYAQRLDLTVGTSEGTGSNNYGVMVDWKNCKAEQNGTPNTNIDPALRIGIRSASKFYVWAPFTSAISVSYLIKPSTPGTAGTVGTWTTAMKQLVTGATPTTYEHLSEGAAPAQIAANAGYLGDIKGASYNGLTFVASDSLELVMYIWFEGTESTLTSNNIGTNTFSYKVKMPYYALTK